MFEPHLQKAILALANISETATPEERNALSRLFSGLPDVLSMTDVCKRLGKSRQTIYALISRGLLVPAKSGGKAGYNRGITAKSVEDYLNSLSQERSA